MGRKGEQTREHIMATAESIILKRGYSGTSIEGIIGEAGITKFKISPSSAIGRAIILDPTSESFTRIGVL